MFFDLLFKVGLHAANILTKSMYFPRSKMKSNLPLIYEVKDLKINQFLKYQNESLLSVALILSKIGF